MSYAREQSPVIIMELHINPPPDKMAAILTEDIFKCLYMDQKFVPLGPIDNRSAQVMACRLIGGASHYLNQC